MTKEVLAEAVSGFNLQVINDNFNKIEVALDEKVLYRDNPAGEPNQMENLLDMNGFRIINLPAPASPNDAARLADIPTEPIPIGVTTALLTSFQPTGTIGSVNVQAAIEEVDANLQSILPAFANAAQGDALVAVQKTGGIARTQHSVNNDFFTPLDAGADPTGVADSTTALNTWIAYAGNKLPYPGTYKVSGQLTLPVNLRHLDVTGMVIDASAGGTFANTAVFYGEGSLTQIADLSVSPSLGDVSLTFGSAHNLVDKDVFIIYNPTNSSFNPSRTYYRAGEYCDVNRVTSSTTVTLWHGLYAGYTAADVDVYRMTPNALIIKGLHVKAPNSGNIRPARFRLYTRLVIENPEMSNSNYVGIGLDRCYNVDINGSNIYQNPSVYNDEYGISIGNSQNVRVNGGTIRAARHAISIGGDDFTGSVPNRNIHINGVTLMNDQASSAPTADIHGNSEDIVYNNCTIYGGASFGGMDNTYFDCTFIGGPLSIAALIAGGSECMGGTYTVEGGRIKSTATYSLGIVRGANGVSATVKDSTLIVKNVVVEQAACDTFARFDMGNDTYKANAHISGITFVQAPSLINILRMVGTGAAGDGDFLVVDDISGAPNGALLVAFISGYGSTVKCRLMRQEGSGSVALNSAAPFSSVTVTYKYSYGSKIPKVTYGWDTRIANAVHPLAVSYRLKSAAQCTFDIYTTDNANAGATPTVVVDYCVGLNET